MVKLFQFLAQRNVNILKEHIDTMLNNGLINVRVKSTNRTVTNIIKF